MPALAVNRREAFQNLRPGVAPRAVIWMLPRSCNESIRYCGVCVAIA